MVCFAVVAGQVGLDLGTDTDTVADLDCLDIFSNFYRLAYDFVADADWEWAVAPAAWTCQLCSMAPVVSDKPLMV